MDLDSLQQLQQTATDTALKSGKIEDIEKAVNITKEFIDMQKTLSDTSNQPALVRYEEFKTWAALIVPFLSIATLAVTIYMQTIQLDATREANETSKWQETVRNVLSQMSKPASVVPDPALAMSLLEPFGFEPRA